MTANPGTIDRVFRFVVGVALLALPFVSGTALFTSTTSTIISVVLGLVILATSAMRFCPIYRIYSIRTCNS